MTTQGLVLSMCAVVAGCGGGDGAGDAGVDGAPGVQTAVTVLDNRWHGEPTPGLTVVFTEEARTQTAITDGAGRAVAALSSPATITVVRPAASPGFSLVSVVGVQPGERVVFGTPDRHDPVRATMEVEVSPYEGGLGPYEYRMYTSCSSGAARGGTGPRQAVSIDRPCEGDRVDVYVEAVLGTQIQASLTAIGQPAADGGVLTLDAGWVGTVILEILFTDRPVDARMYPDVHAYYRGRRVTASAHPIYCREPTPTCTFLPWLAPTADRVAIDARFERLEGAGALQQQRTVFALADGAKRTVPIRLLPWVSDGLLDPGTRRVTWRSSTGEPADAAALVLASDEVGWLLVAPPDLQELRVPDLSGIAGVDAPDLATLSGTLLLFEREDTDGYDEFRAAAEPLSWAAFNDDIGARISSVPVDVAK